MIIIKQNFFDLNLLKLEWKFFSVLSAISGFILSLLDISRGHKFKILVVFIIIFVLSYIVIYIYYRFLNKKLKLSIGKCNITIKFNDIFEEEGLKVIPVNEYFDTKVDGKIISSSTLHGKFIKKNYTKVDKLKLLDGNIESELVSVPYEKNKDRTKGKTKRYPIGTTILIDDYILTALTRFDEDNRAYLSMHEYLMFLNKFWNEIDKIHNNRIINVPVIGTGISRINPILTEQEYLEQILWALKTSTLISSKSNINIIVYTADRGKISLLKFKKIFKKGVI